MAWAIPLCRLPLAAKAPLTKLQRLGPASWHRLPGSRPLQVTICAAMAQLAVRDSIDLTQQEQELFQTLLEAAKHTNTGTVLRVAGGWVRDKLLGRDSLDIDIALDNMMGKEFADRVNEYLLSKNKKVSTTAVIQSNPDQSKHLETARMKIDDVWIDLVNLRSEKYAEESRIPTMEFGTPKEDAERRDFTINSLFYNINEGTVEDFTNQGLEDLRQGIMRTPLPAAVTFKDDPLRVLRGVRFATRFGFELEESIITAARSEEVHREFNAKISRERVGTELEGMFNGPDPVASMRLLCQLHLFPEVFKLPRTVQGLVAPGYGEQCVTCMAATFALMQAQRQQLDKEQRRMLLLAGLLLPLRNLTFQDGKKLLPACGEVVRSSIKWRVKDVDAVLALHEEAPALLQLHRAIRNGCSTTVQFDSVPEGTRALLGLSIRKKLKQLWPLGMILAPVTALPAARPLGEEASTSSTTAETGEDTAEAAQHRLEICAELMDAVAAFELGDCWQWKTLLDGKKVMEALGLQKAGPELGKWMDALTEWQLAHPHGTQQEAVTFIQQYHETMQKR